MRKTLLIALGLASFGALAGVQPASADWIKKRVCNDHYLIIGPAYKLSSHCNSQEAWKKNNCTTNVGPNLKECFDVDVLVPSDWKGASASGINKTFNPSTNLKNK